MTQISTFDELREYEGTTLHFVKQFVFSRDGASNLAYMFRWNVGPMFHPDNQSRDSGNDLWPTERMLVTCCDCHDISAGRHRVQTILPYRYLSYNADVCGLSGIFVNGNDASTRMALIRLVGIESHKTLGTFNENQLRIMCNMGYMSKEFVLHKLCFQHYLKEMPQI